MRFSVFFSKKRLVGSYFAMALRNLGTTVAPAGEKFFDLRVVPVTSVDWFIPHFLIPWSFHNALFP